MNYRIADFTLEITFAEGGCNDESLISSFSVFACDVENAESGHDKLFCMHVDDSLVPLKKDRIRIGKFDTGNGITVVDRFPDGTYQFILKDIDGDECALLRVDRDFFSCRCALKGTFSMRRFGLNNALMLAFAFSACSHKAILLHASLVRHNGFGYAFVAKSGTGKSTQVSNWLRYIPNCDLMNDDNPIMRIVDGKTMIYGSPWSGKTSCFRNVKAELGALTCIERSLSNSVERLSGLKAYARIMPSCSTMKWDCNINNKISNVLAEVLSTTPAYVLYCLPDRNSAEVCHEAITRQTEDRTQTIR